MLQHSHQIGRLWAGAVLWAALLLAVWPLTAAAQVATIRIEPLQVTGGPGEDLSVQVVIADVENLGFFQFELTFDPTVVRIKSMALGEFLASTGRAASGIGPVIDNEQGRLTFGGYTIGDQAGPDGTGSLAEITLTGVGDGTSSLDLSNIKVLSAKNTVIVTALPGRATVIIGNPVTPTPTPLVAPTTVGSNASPTVVTAAPGPTTTSGAQPTSQAGTTATAPPAATITAQPTPSTPASATSAPRTTPQPAATETFGVQPTTVAASPEVTAVASATALTTPLTTAEPTVVTANTATRLTGAAETPALESVQPTVRATMTAASSEPIPAPTVTSSVPARQPSVSAGTSERISAADAPSMLLKIAAGALVLAGIIVVAIIVLARRRGS